MVCLNPEEAFHIHTWRCGHAEDEREDAYIRVAMYLGAKQITFTKIGAWKLVPLVMRGNAPG